MTASNALFEENHDIFRESVKRFIKKHVTPFHEEWEKEGVVPRDFWLEAGAAGILCPDLPTQYGGPGGDFRHNVVVLEEMMKKAILTFSNNLKVRMKKLYVNRL